MHDFQKLGVWREAHRLTLDVYRATSRYPVEERYGLISQSRRAAASVGANIVEGAGRNTQNQLRQFISIARGSLNELGYHLLLAHDLGYLEPDPYVELSARVAALRLNLDKFRMSVHPEPARYRASSPQP